MIKLIDSLASWNSDDFKPTFIREVMQLTADELPLQQALQHGSYATLENCQLMINSISERDDRIIIDTGIFFSSVIAGCNCSDDPTPVDLNSEYGEFRFVIKRSNADTEISLL